MAPDPETWARRLVGSELNGRYRLDRLVGVGGMGAVYAAEHVAVGRRVAVKMLLPEMASDRQTVKRFHQEARSAAAVGGRGVVDIFDFDHDPAAGPYLVMELLAGESLASRIDRLKKLEPTDVLWVGQSLLRTLAKVHAQGIVHRDLKPDNVFIAREENEDIVKILDFGISRVMGSDPQRDSALLTRPGVVLGTPTYMAPEQARGDPGVDHRADLYAVGAILFECCAGRPPHVGSNWQQVFAMVLTAPPPSLRSLRPGLPETLYATVERALARDADERFQSAESMLASLSGVAEPVPRTRGAEADAVPRTRAQPVTPIGGAWGGSQGAAAAVTPPAQGTPYAVATDHRTGGGRGGCLVAASLGAALLAAAGGIGVAIWLALGNGGSAETDRTGVSVHPVADGGVAVAPSRDSGDTKADGAVMVAAAADAGSDEQASADARGDERGGRPDTGRTNRGAGRGGDRTDPASMDTTAGTDTGDATSPPTHTPTPTPPPPSGSIDATLRARLDAAHAHRRAGRARQAREGYEDVVHLAWTAEVPSGSAGARYAAEARLALGDMAADGVRPFGRAPTSEEFQRRWQRVVGAVTRAAEQYGRVAMYGHTDLTQCGMVRSGRLYEQLAEVAERIEAPQNIVDVGGGAVEDFESGFRDTSRSYLETARTTYEAAANIGQGPCRAQAVDALRRVMRDLGRRIP